MDHGVSVGPIQGLTDMAETINNVRTGGADAVLVHAGIAKTVDTIKMGLIIHLSGATRLTNEPNWKAQLTTVKTAVHLGADAVSVHVNVGSEHEQTMLGDFSHIAEQCDDYGLPILTMMYPRGPKISNEHAPEMVGHAARLGYEIGADIVKTNYTGNIDSFRDVVNSVKVPIIVAGGPKTNSENDTLRIVHDSIHAGAAGVSIGRNVFQDTNPTLMTRTLVEIVHNGASIPRAISILGETNEKTVLARA
jgi:fructose-bisphosphate aldolase/2-amino-3,7-dideoxy-D-threo-hept-6-ulosonate synthase